MPLTTNEDQFKFLISCIRWSNNGKVDFTEVAKECKIVTKGAAAKRYERMMKAHGIAPNTATVRSRGFKTENQEVSAPPAKKRKAVDDFANDIGTAGDDQEDFDSAPIKPDPSFGIGEFRVKQEPGQMHVDNSQHLMQFLPELGTDDQSYGHGGVMFGHNTTDYNTMASHANLYGIQQQPEFIPFGGYEQPSSSTAENTAAHDGGCQHESIVIGD